MTSLLPVLNIWLTLWLTPWVATPDAETPVLTLDGNPVSEAEYEDWLVRSRGPMVAREFSLMQIVEREAARRGIVLEDGAVETEVRRLREQRVRNAFQGSVDAWRRELRTLGRTERGLLLERRIDTRNGLLAERLIGEEREVPESVIVRAWEEQYGPGGVRPVLELIQFSLPGSRRARLDEEELQARESAARARADAAYSRLLAGEKFEDLVRELSDDHDSRLRGGLAPADFSLGAWPEESVLAINALEAGEISPPLSGPRGLWIVRVKERVTTPLEKVHEGLVREQLERPPGSEEVQAFVESLMGSATLEVLPAMHAKAPAPGEWLAGDEVVVRSGDWEAERGALADWLRRYRGEAWVERFRLDWVIRREAAKAEISVSEAQVRERALADTETIIENNFDGDRDSWLANLRNAGRTEELYAIESEARARGDLLAEALLIRDREVTDSEIRGAWLERYGEDGRTVRARMIMLRPEPPEELRDATEEEAQKIVQRELEAARQQALDLRSRIEDGEDFGALARQFSGDPETAARGGRMEDRFHQEEWPAEVAEAVLATAPGDVTEPLLLGLNWFLFQITESRVVALEEVRDDLRAELQVARPSETELAAFRNVITREVEIEILPAMYE